MLGASIIFAGGLAIGLPATGFAAGLPNADASANDTVHGARAQCISPEPRGYRLEGFRALTPCTLAGAVVVDTLAVQRLAATGAALIDVLPAPRRPGTIGADELWLPPLRDNIPGSLWLPNTGFGVLPREEENYLRSNLERIGAGRKDAAMVFYCDADCWMSWNAARRAVEWGYTSVYWYPGGADAWRDAGLGLEAAEPVARVNGQ